MLIQASTPRILFNVNRYPEHVYIHTLAKPGVSDGGVLFNATTDPTQGIRQTKSLEPSNVYPIQGEDGFESYEYVLPFWELFRRSLAKRPGSTAIVQADADAFEDIPQVSQTTLDWYGAKGYGHRLMVPFATGGFLVTVRTAFRASPTEYVERVLGLHILMPVTGGGIIRLGDSLYDLANPSFDPYAEDPKPRQNLDHLRSVNETHRLRDSKAEDRKAERIRAAEESMSRERSLGEGPSRALPPHRRR